MATILTSRETEAPSFEKTVEEIEALKTWLRTKRCRAVVMESTGVYWIPLYAAVESDFEVEPANA